MKSFASILAAGAFLALAACGQPAQTPAAETAAEQAVAGVTLTDPWAAVSAGGASVAGGYVTLRNDSDQADRLVSVSSPRAARVETHEMIADGAIMRMRAVASIEVPAHGEAVLAPGGLHLMFFDIDAPFVEGETVPVTLQFENHGVVESSFAVRSRAMTSDAHASH